MFGPYGSGICRLPHDFLLKQNNKIVISYLFQSLCVKVFNRTKQIMFNFKVNYAKNKHLSLAQNSKIGLILCYCFFPEGMEPKKFTHIKSKPRATPGQQKEQTRLQLANCKRLTVSKSFTMSNRFIDINKVAHLFLRGKVLQFCCL